MLLKSTVGANAVLVCVSNAYKNTISSTDGGRIRGRGARNGLLDGLPLVSLFQNCARGLAK